jgi:hypothetical protein
MTAEEKGYLKSQIRQYIVNSGVPVTSTDADRINCPCHEDAHASMIIYETAHGGKMDGLYCPVCGAKLDIFGYARLMAGIPDGDNHFPEVVKNVQDTLGISGAVPIEKKTEPVKKIYEKNTSFVSLPIPEARNIYISSHILSMAQRTFKENVTKIESAWKSLDPDGNVALVEVRFPAECFSDGKKKYLTYWYDGKNLRSANPPYLLYNRDRLDKDHDTPFCIHEGPKCIFAAGVIPGMIATGYNSGGKKYREVAWSPLDGRSGYIYPDDDDVGRKTADEIKKILTEEHGCSVVICDPLDVRDIKKEGGDIVEALQKKTPEELSDYILGCTGKKEIPDGNISDANDDIKPPKTDPSDIPFRVLGCADDGFSYFVDCSGDLVKYKSSTFTKGQLLVLAPLPWWDREFGMRHGINWDDAIDFLIRASQGIRFDPAMIRGVGAWSEDDGRICFNTGTKIYGDAEKKRLYMKRTEYDPGLGIDPADFSVRREMFDSARLMSFENTADCARVLAWAVLAPFGGALPWRPAGFITGESGSGKSTVIDLIVKKLSFSEICSGMSTTPAGILQRGKYKSTGVIIDEAGDDSEKSLKNRTEIFEIMRQSTGKDAPKGWKGTADGAGIDYELYQMFLFAAINPVINNKADENRMFYVTMIKPADKWAPIRDRIKNAFTDDKCQAVRSWTWINIKKIIDGAENIVEEIEETGSKSHRDAYIDALLFSAFFLCFQNGIPEQDKLHRFFESVYSRQITEDDNDAEEFLDRLLDEQVFLIGEGMHKLTLRRIMYGIFTGKAPAADNDTGQQFAILPPDGIARYKQTAIQYGLGLTVYNGVQALAVVSNHHQIAKITEVGKGYNRILWRHPQLLDKSKQVNFSGIGDTTRRCVIISDIFTDDEIPF